MNLIITMCPPFKSCHMRTRLTGLSLHIVSHQYPESEGRQPRRERERKDNENVPEAETERGREGEIERRIKQETMGQEV